MKIMYKCEFCGRSYEKEAFARQCEAACRKKANTGRKR